MATIVFVLFWVLLGIAVVMAAMRSGRRTPLIDSSTRGGRRTAALLAAAAAVLFLVAIPIAVGLSGDDPAQAGAVRLSEAEQQGRTSFYKNCGQCHTLGAANAVGRVGPDLDELRPPKALVLDAIDKGRARGQGQMPAQVVEGEEADQVAAFVAKTAGR
jgi:mono/diheme cytochrome c family protein